MDQEAAMKLVSKAIEKEGSQKAFAQKHALSPAFVNDITQGRRELSKAILDAVGLERVTLYRRKEAVQ